MMITVEQKPELVQAMIDFEDITDSVQTLYGDDKQWNHRIIRLRDFLTFKDLGKDLRIKWRRNNGRVDCVITRVRDLDAVLCADLFHTNQR